MRLRLLVRGRKDAKAARAALERFYPGFNYTVETLGGLRGEALAREVTERASPFTIALLPEAEARHVDTRKLPPFARLVAFKSRDLRNLRVEQIASLVDRGRALIRLGAEWLGGVGAYRLDSNVLPPGLRAEPDIDNFILINNGLKALSQLLGVELDGHALVYIGNDLAHIYYGGMLLATLDLKGSPPRGARIEAPQPPRASLEGLLEANREPLGRALNEIRSWLSTQVAESDLVIVPWSGGKDSTLALLLAREAAGSDRVVAVHVDTGLEFPETEEYIERISGILGVTVVRASAGLDRAVVGGRGLPRRGDRWCTGMKLEALASAVRRLSRNAKRPIVVVGDRDAESRARSRRPPLRIDPYHGLRTLAPLKLLGGGHVTLSLLLAGLPLNKLYLEGFYRIGCFVCPYMSGWEKWLLARGLSEGVSSKAPWARSLIRLFLAEGAS